jgi:hypothetical protein
LIAGVRGWYDRDVILLQLILIMVGSAACGMVVGYFVGLGLCVGAHGMAAFFEWIHPTMGVRTALTPGRRIVAATVLVFALLLSLVASWNAWGQLTRSAFNSF